MYYAQRLAALKNERSSWEDQWRNISKYLLPRTGRFLLSETNRGEQKFNNIYDSTGTYALGVLASGLMAGVTSPARPWFQLSTLNPELDESLNVKRWLADVTTLMQMVFAKSNTYRMLPVVYEEIAAYGTAASVLLQDFDRVIHHFPLTVGEYALATDYKGAVNTLYREFVMSPAQMIEEFGIDNVSSKVKSAYDRAGGKDQWFTVVQAIEPRPEALRDPRKRDAINMPFRSVYFEPDESRPLRESGFRRFPALCPRWQVVSGDVYGQSPGMAVLGDLKQLQHEQVAKSKGIDYKVNPPLQVPTTFKGRESAFLPGGLSYIDQNNPNGGVRTAFEVQLDLSYLLADIQDVRQRIRSSFFVDVFLMMADRTGQPLTATEVAERHEEKLMVLGPVLENLHHELLDPLIDLTFTRMLEAGMVPPPPQELAGQELNVEFMSVLAQAQRAIATNSIDRFTNSLGVIAQAKPEVLDKLDADRWVDVYSDALGVNPELIVPGEQVALIRQQRAQAQQQMQQAAAAQQAVDAAQKLGSVPAAQPTALSELMSNFSGL